MCGGVLSLVAVVLCELAHGAMLATCAHIHSFTLIHSVTHSFTLLLTHSLCHSLTHSLTHSLIHSVTQGVHIDRKLEDIGAGDQGHMFGYASDETEELMPLTQSLASQLAQRLSQLRKDGTLAWARPDSKTQVSFELKAFAFRV